MSDAVFPIAASAPRLAALGKLLSEEIPLSAQMGVSVDALDETGLTVSMPLAPNRNPHQTAFAGSLNALCTIAGWGMTHLLTEQLGVSGSTVIRRSSIKYAEPIQTARVQAICLPPAEAELAHFRDMLLEKRQAKLDHVVRSPGVLQSRPAVLFSGSYVVTRHDGRDAI